MWPGSDQLLSARVDTRVALAQGWQAAASQRRSWITKRYGRCMAGDSWRFAWPADRHLPDASAVPAGKWNALQIHHGSSDSRRIMSRITARLRASFTTPSVATARRWTLPVSEYDVHHLALLSWLHSCHPGIIEQGCFSSRPVWHLISVELCSRSRFFNLPSALCELQTAAPVLNNGKLKVSTTKHLTFVFLFWTFNLADLN